MAQLLRDPSRIGEVVGTQLEAQHFYSGPYRLVYDEIVTAYFADDPVDPLTIGEMLAPRLARLLSIDVSEAPQKVQAMAQRIEQGNPVDHAKLVKRDSDYRALLALASNVSERVETEEESPEQLASKLSQAAMEVATSRQTNAEIIDFDTLGKHFLEEQEYLRRARAAGVDVGAKFGLSAVDDWTRGLRPGELLFLAGPAGAGKSALSWRMAQNFVERQGKQPEDRRVAGMVLSLEMSEEPSSERLASAISGINGGKIREGMTTNQDMAFIAEQWRKRKGLGLYFNFSSNLRAGPMRALIVEAVRRHNVGLVIIDHFKYLLMDERYDKQTEEEEAKARFLKQDVARQLNVAVVCLAHQTKAPGQRDDRRPRLEDLRGSGLVGGDADYVAFVHRPYEHASDEKKENGEVSRTDAELIWAKARHGLTGIAKFYFDPSKMDIRDPSIAAGTAPANQRIPL